MTGATTPLVESLEAVVSQAEGEGVILRRASDLNDACVEALRERAEAFREANDVLGAEEFNAYATLARNLSTLRGVLSVEIGSAEEGKAVLEANKPRFDAEFIRFLERKAGSHVQSMREALERLTGGDAGAAEEAEARGATERARFEVQFLDAVAGFSPDPTARARADMMNGTFLLVRAQLEEARHEESAGTRAEAESRLNSCAGDEKAPADLRAMAEGNLAVVAGEAHLDRVMKHQARAQELAEKGGDIDQLRTIRLDRAFWAEKRQDWDTALDLYRQNTEDTERKLWSCRSLASASDLVRATRSSYAGAVRACVELARARQDPSLYQQALEFADKGKARMFLRSLADIAFGHSKPVPNRLRERRDQILERLRQLGDLQRLSTDVAELHRGEMESLLDALGEAEAQIQSLASSAAFDLQRVPLEFEQMTALVAEGGAILSYFSLEDRLFIFVLAGAGLAGPPAEVPVSAETLARAMVNLNVTILMRQNGKTLADLRDGQVPELLDFFLPTDKLEYLYNVLIEPVGSQIQGLSPLQVIPHGSLRDLPFHALQDANGGSLIDHAAVAYAPSLAVLKACRERRRDVATTCFAAGVAESKGGPAGAQEEAEDVARFFGTEPGPATREAVLSRAGQCDVVHLACHSDTLSAITAFQGLVLEDGMLPQQEIAGTRCHASLVTLSACSTAQGDLGPGIEMTGITGAFVRAGAASVVTSLWPVETSVARSLMSTFYSAWKQPGTSKAEALRRAQVEMKAQRSHPYFWAPLSLWGDF